MRSTPGRRIAFELVRLLPKNALSRLAGRFAEIAWPVRFSGRRSGSSPGWWV
ncbi:MAG: hypothetical protein R3E53_19090 [Myxococcota bacterium]